MVSLNDLNSKLCYDLRLWHNPQPRERLACRRYTGRDQAVRGYCAMIGLCQKIHSTILLRSIAQFCFSKYSTIFKKVRVGGNRDPDVIYNGHSSGSIRLELSGAIIFVCELCYDSMLL